MFKNPVLPFALCTKISLNFNSVIVHVSNLNNGFQLIRSYPVHDCFKIIIQITVEIIIQSQLIIIQTHILSIFTKAIMQQNTIFKFFVFVFEV